MAGRVLPGQEAGPIRRTQGHGMEGVRERCTLLRQAIDMRRLEVRMPASSEFIKAEIVDYYNDDIRPISVGGGLCLERG